VKTIDIILNGAIFLVTLILLLRHTRQDGIRTPDRLKKAFRYFTCQSNVLCAVAALLTAVSMIAGDVPEWIRMLKYAGTVSVTVTMLTVFLFLAPSIGKGWFGALLKGPSNLFMHLITPLAAIVSFCVFEKRGMSFPQSLWGLAPLAVYGQHYIYRIRYAPEGKRWDDFYGFNRQGKWPAAFGIMLIATFGLCMLFMLAQNA
jgi:hypothetical protein